MQTVSVSEIQRNLHKLDGFDIIEVVDKKRNLLKGYFLDKKYHAYIQEIIQDQEDKKSDVLFDKVRGIIPSTVDPIAWQKALREENESNPYEELDR